MSDKSQQPLVPVYRPTTDPQEEPELIAEGFSFDVDLRAEVEGKWVNWTERRWLVRSVAFAQGQQRKLHKRRRNRWRWLKLTRAA